MQLEQLVEALGLVMKTRYQDKELDLLIYQIKKY